MTPELRPAEPIIKSDAYWAQVRAVAAQAPPLTKNQRDIIRRAFRPVLAAMASERLGRAS